MPAIGRAESLENDFSRRTAGAAGVDGLNPDERAESGRPLALTEVMFPTLPLKRSAPRGVNPARTR